MKEKKKKRSRICELKTLFTGGCGGTDQGKVSTTSFSGESGCCTGFAYSRSKPKMVEAYFFDDNDSDDHSASDLSPLIRRPSQQDNSAPYVHIITGYLSIVEFLMLLGYLGGLIGLTIWNHDYSGNSTTDLQLQKYLQKSSSTCKPDKMVAYFCMTHVAIWVMVGVIDRIVQWRHQVLRRKGYLKFYRQMKNIRRVSFIVVSICNAALLMYVSLLYFFGISSGDTIRGLRPIVVLYFMVGLEMLFSLPCLVYYIVRAIIFNCQKQSPDVIQETYSGPQSPTASVTALGFRDGEDMDELLERQADMIRYLQQHNANLGRRILELQSQNMD